MNDAEMQGRPARVGAAVKQLLNELLAGGKLRDPGLAKAYVSRVSLNSDLSVAQVGVRHLDLGDATVNAQRATVAACRRAGGALRRHIAQSLRLRQAPELKFSWDATPEAAERMDAVFAEIARDRDASS